MQYMILIYGDPSKFATMTEAERGQMFGAYGAYNEALKNAGVLRGLNWLQGPDAATTLKPDAGGAAVHDGPFLASKESLGGYYVIEVADLDAALAWAKQCPGLQHGGLEIRPVLGVA